MKHYLKQTKRIMTGQIRITEKQKFSFIIYSVTLIHIFLAALFALYEVKPLLIFNFLSVFIYLYCIWLVRRELLWPVYYITYTEIILHAFFATICIGWQYGFAQYIIALIPVGYYICYTMKDKRHTIMTATISALLATIAFLCCKVLSFFTTPLYEQNMQALELRLYIFNSFCIFTFLIIFSLVFISEMNWSREQLLHQNEILDKLASTDPLTGLYNRRSMDIFLHQALKSASGFTLIMSDIDDFKKINDTYGHDFGDIVLREIARITTHQVGSNGYVCRWGGEEILILINSPAKEHAEHIAENIRRNVAGHIFKLNNKWIHCTVTLGVSICREGDSIEETITNADHNLYHGKKNGKNRVVA